MVGWLIQQKNIGFVVDELAKANLCLLAAAEYLHHAFDMLCGQATFCQSGTHLILRKRRKFLPDFINTGDIFGVFLFLLKIAGIKIIPQFRFAAERWDFAEDAFQQSGFPNPVCTDKRNFLSAFHGKGERSGKGFIISNHQILCLENVSACGTRLFEVEFRLWLFLRQFDDVHFIQLFLTGHCHISCGNTRFIASNEVL